jgi:hypothetical protein
MSWNGGVRINRVRAGVVGAAFVVAVVMVRLVYRFMFAKGVIINGDEPAYIMLAQALYHGSVHIVPYATHDVASHVFGKTYAPGATINNVERYPGPRGVVSPFEPGLSLLLTPFVAVLGAVRGGVLGICVINVAGLTWLHQRAARLFSLRPMAQIVLAVAFAIPAILLAATQIFPDLPAGILIAAACLELAAFEREGAGRLLSLAIVTICICYLPWLQPKNLAPAGLIGLAYLFVVGRAWRGDRRDTRFLIGSLVLMALSVVLFAVYNIRYYGHWLGFPEHPIQVDKQGLQLILGLLFDKHQGLFVQVPWCAVALAGLVGFGARRYPVAVVTSLVTFVVILFLNGTYVVNPYGGGSLAGRFMWTLIPILLPWLGIVLARAQEAGREMIFPLVAAAAVVVYQAQPILAGQHKYFNALVIQYEPYPIWWRGLGHVLPQMARTSQIIGIPAWALLFELVVLAAGVAASLFWAGGLPLPGGRRRRPIGTHARA